MQPGNRAAKVLNILKEELPSCFKRGSAKQPLALGIHKQVLDHYMGDGRFSRKDLRRAIEYYTSSHKYLRTITAGASRINLDGSVNNTVSQQEELHAKEKLPVHRPQRSMPFVIIKAQPEQINHTPKPAAAYLSKHSLFAFNPYSPRTNTQAPQSFMNSSRVLLRTR